MTTQQLIRGDRDYVLGADILDAILAEFSVGQDWNFDFVVQRKCKKQFRIVGELTDIPAESVVGRYQDSSHRLWVIEGQDMLTERVEDDEATLQSYLTWKDQMVFAETLPDSFSFSRYCVVGFKTLLNTQVLKDSKNKFLFTRLKVHKQPDFPCGIEYKRCINKRFYEGRIVGDGEQVGEIYFYAE